MYLPTFFFQLFVVIFFSILDENSTRYTTWQNWAIAIAQCVYCILLVRGSKMLYYVCYEYFIEKKSIDFQNLFFYIFKQFLLFSGSVFILLCTNRYLVGHQLAVVFAALTLLDIVEHSLDDNDMVVPKSINYGTGMACSFFEGYLNLVIPNNGGDNSGFENKINAFESKERVRFPVRKLFLVITKSLFCPPDLVDFNKAHRPDLAHLEGVSSLEDVERNVAGVRNRQYRNSVYKIHRPHKPRPVCLVAECATPLHTLYKVLQNRVLYNDLGRVNTDEIVQDFCSTLQSILDRSPECRNKCELVYYDDTNPEQNLADILLDRIAQLQKNFEEIIEQTR